MLRIPEHPLPDDAVAQLAAYQAEVDAAGAYESRVKEARDLFSKRNQKGNPVFDVVRTTLGRMCGGVRRCMYCEDSVADEVEHFKPKNFFPELVFEWANYLYACGPCNSGKNNKFPIVTPGGGQIVHLTRKRGGPVLPPEAGDAALMDLRNEDPLEYLQLDLQDTFRFVPVSSDETSLEYRRADVAVAVLGLNERDYLPRTRRGAFHAYLALLERYIRLRNYNEEPAKLDLIKDSLKRMGHPTVWAEMKRQRDRLPDLKHLFEQAPEALEW
jgi:5-methylcytosine-specific restriction endonuclease McrA